MSGTPPFSAVKIIAFVLEEMNCERAGDVREDVQMELHISDHDAESVSGKR